MSARLRPILPILALTVLLGMAWTATDWARLSRLMLPDTDDAMRLQQVRDWIAGQGFGDISQHRLAGGLAMHWSRIGDIVLAAIILALRPLAGSSAAELVAVVAWPLLQLAALLIVLRDVTRHFAVAAGPTALVLAVLAYPATSLFLPGRIDHHAMQVLLVLVQLRAGLAPAGFRSGVVAGGAVAVGAIIGLETLPFALVTGAIVTLERLRGDGARMTGFGLTLAVGLLVLAPFAARGGACDTVRPLLPLAIAGGLALAAIGRIDRRPLILLIAGVIALSVLGRSIVTTCAAGPYGTVDPIVARLWLQNVGEAQPLVSAPASAAIGYAGLLIAGVTATAWLAWRRHAGWGLALAYQLAALAITLVQVRGAYVGAALAVVPFAVLLTEARAARRTPGIVALWIVGAGVTYPLAAGIIAPKATAVAVPALDCGGPAMLDRLRRLPPGVVMTGIDAGSYILAGTPHAVIAAPYHRNNAGNAAMYRFFLGPASEAAAIARRWRVRYVAVCPGMFGPVRPAAGTIGGGTMPDWLRPVDTARTLYVVRGTPR
ncbi:hypothetical protein ASE86_14010 [Sphingomonas sp. Leaf33]|uniref:hypothetical protein n=1 Tax=Sphingomonas sp. Leaf33 TaxID=1736215 RepID=UPI0006FC518C|nr:hypothetical protein [Sphingomonas sp. Leaf33]KQN19565.1 hypothetical protein ASE86_14010 [Sphingomonas sp. Leaf33]